MADIAFAPDPQTGLLVPEAFLKSKQALAEAAERQARGKFFSAMGRAERYNQAGAQEKPPDEPSFRYLRDAYYESVIDQICVMRRQQQVRAMCRRVRNPETEIGWQVVHIDHDRPDFEETQEIRERCAEVEDIIEHGPTPEVHPGGFADLASAAVEEELVIDRKCFPYETIIETDQGPMYIGKIVNRRLPVKIRSIDLETGREVWGQVTAWQKFHTNTWVRLAYEGSDRHASLHVTPDHEVWTPSGMQPASSLHAGDTVYVASPVLSAEQEQVVLGGLLGDAFLNVRQGSRIKLGFAHSLKQEYYLRWKAEALKSVGGTAQTKEVVGSFSDARYNGKIYDAVEWRSMGTPLWNQYREFCYRDGRKHVTREWLDRIGPLGLAVWFMDDATFSFSNGGHTPGDGISIQFTECYDEEELGNVISYFSEKWGVTAKLAASRPAKSRPRASVCAIRFGVQDSKKLLDAISPCVAIERTGKGNGAQKRWMAGPIPQGHEGMAPVRLVSVETHNAKPKKRVCYDITVEPTHTIVAQGLVVSNCMVRFRDRGGFPRQFHMIDGGTLKPIVRVLYEWVEEHKGEENQWGPDMWDVAAEALSYEVGFDMTRAAYVQEVDGVIVAAWATAEIDVDITNPSVEINRLAYGRGSAFQRSMTLTDLAISMIDYNRGLFSVDYPENALFLFGDYSPSGLEAFTRQLTSQVGNRNWSRLAIIPADPEFKAQLQKLRDTPKDMVFDRLWQLVIALKAASFGMHPSEINAAGYESEAPALNQPNEEKQIAYAKEEGLHGLIQHLADWLNRAIVTPRYPDLRMRWHVRLDTERERVELANLRVQQYGTINEARKAENKSPIAKPWADYPMQIAAIYAQAETQQQALQMQQKAASQQQAAERAHETDMASQESAERLAAGESRPREQSGQQSWPRGNAGPVRGVGQKRRQASAAAQRGATGLPRTSTEHGLQESARRVVVSARGMHAEADDGRIRLKVRGRTYLLESGPYGATWRAPNGAVVLHSDRVPDSPEGAAAELEEALEDARGA